MATEDSPASEQPRHAGLMVRLGAALIDAVIMGAPVSLIVSVIFRVNLEEGNDYFSIPNLVTFALVGVITDRPVGELGRANAGQEDLADQDRLVP